MYKVILFNDDYTPGELVIYILEKFFSKSRVEATTIMTFVHKKGAGVCGVFTKEIAETKVEQSMNYAQKHEHPLMFNIEPTDGDE